MQLNASFKDIMAPEETDHSLFCAGAVIEGTLRFEGPVTLEGEVHGEIIANDLLVISETAIIKANITAQRVIVHGKVIGNLVAKGSIALEETAVYSGKITSPSIKIEEGALFEGHASMSDVVREADPAKDKSVKSPVVDLQGKLDEFVA
jgi:cytoskeletal protein CcmA (bactofilin family)